MYSVCFEWISAELKGHDGGLAASDLPYLFSVPFLFFGGFKLEPVYLNRAAWLFPLLLNVCVCLWVRLYLVQMYRTFHPAAEPAFLMLLAHLFAAGWAFIGT